MKIAITKIVWLLALCLVGTAMAAQRHPEEAYEVEKLRIAMTGPDSGQIIANKYPDYTDVVLEVTKETRLFKGKTQLPLSQAAKFAGEAGVVFCDPETRQVTRILIY